MNDDPFKSLHDAILCELLLDWEKGIATIQIQLGENQPVLLKATGVASLSVPRARPWGPSIRINKTRGPSQMESGLLRLDIQMQSGDIIELIARSFDWQAP